MVQVRYLLIISLLLFSCSKKKEIKKKEIPNVKSVIIKPKDTVKIVFKDTIKPIRTILKKSDKLKVVINGKIYYKQNIGDTPHNNRHDEDGSETYMYFSINGYYYDIRTPNKPTATVE